MRQLLLPLGTLLTVVSVVACSSDDSSSEQPPAPAASQIKNDTPQQQNQDASKSNPLPGQQTPVTQTPVQQGTPGYFEASNGVQRYLIPASARIAIRFPVEVTADPDKSLVLPGTGDLQFSEEKLPQIESAIADAQGNVIFPVGARLLGTLKMSAPKAVFNVTQVKVGSINYSMTANSEVTSTQFDKSSSSLTRILLGAVGGAGIAVLIDGMGQDRSITWWAPLIGAGTGAAAAALLWRSTQPIVQVKANEASVLVPGPR